MKNLAPNIFRQRAVLEGRTLEIITPEKIKTYLSTLSKEIDMVALMEPLTHRSDKFGWCGWMHWETSGVHLYAWEKPTPFFSVDIYPCKKFDPQVAVAFTKQFFKANPIVFKSF